MEEGIGRYPLHGGSPGNRARVERGSSQFSGENVGALASKQVSIDTKGEWEKEKKKYRRIYIHRHTSSQANAGETHLKTQMKYGTEKTCGEMTNGKGMHNWKLFGFEFPWTVFGSVYAPAEENLTVIGLTTKWPIVSCLNSTWLQRTYHKTIAPQVLHQGKQKQVIFWLSGHASPTHSAVEIPKGGWMRFFRFTCLTWYSPQKKMAVQFYRFPDPGQNQWIQFEALMIVALLEAAFNSSKAISHWPAWHDKTRAARCSL